MDMILLTLHYSFHDNPQIYPIIHLAMIFHLIWYHFYLYRS